MNYTPYGRTVGKYNTVTAEIDYKGGGNIVAMIKSLVQPLVENMKVFLEEKKYFVIEMENYFTFTKAMAMLREFMIVVLGTARFRPGWPSQNVKEIDDIQINFNEIF